MKISASNQRLSTGLTGSGPRIYVYIIIQGSLAPAISGIILTSSPSCKVYGTYLLYILSNISLWKFYEFLSNGSECYSKRFIMV